MPSARATLLLAAAFASCTAPAWADSPNGADGAGGLQVGTSTNPAAQTSGGAGYKTALRTPPVAARFALSPGRVRTDRRPTIVVRIDQPDVQVVSARVTLYAGQHVVRLSLGRLRTGRVLRLAWPRGVQLPVGRYRVLLHVTGGGIPLARSASARGETTLVVVPKPRPKPKPKPVVPVSPPAPAPAPAPSTGVFPVAGPHSYGDGIGAARNGHTHQGQDVLAAEGTPVVAPTAGTIAYTDYQRQGAGWYVVENADDGRAFFFAHCRTNTIVVQPGQRVAAGAQLCGVGHTGDASGPHLHFEIWVGGWRVDADSHFIDPLAQLKAWDR